MHKLLSILRPFWTPLSLCNWPSSFHPCGHILLQSSATSASSSYQPLHRLMWWQGFHWGMKTYFFLGISAWKPSTFLWPCQTFSSAFIFSDICKQQWLIDSKDLTPDKINHTISLLWQWVGRLHFDLCCISVNNDGPCLQWMVSVLVCSWAEPVSGDRNVKEVALDRGCAWQLLSNAVLSARRGFI